VTDSETGPPRIEKHEARDRAGKAALRAAHDLGAALAGDDDGVPDPVVLDRRGPHRSIDRLSALIDAALDEAAPDEAASDGGYPDRPAR
jgi:hypothetical protein